MSTAKSPRDDIWRSELERLVDRFEVAWQRGEQPAIDDYLPIDPAQRHAMLVELVHVDLERRLARGEAVRVETYLEKYPELSRNRAIVIDLIASEYRLRNGRDPGLTISTFAERFPQYRDELPQRLAGPPRPRRRFPIRLNCPHCNSPIEVVTDSREKEILCPSCGSSFRIDADHTQTWSKDKLPQLGKFELIEAVGRGAFGTVYRARDVQLQRIVAVKVPRSGRLATDEDEDRFVREARNVAQLQHAGIVPVYEVGRSDTFPYIVSEFVEGITLADALTARRFSSREAAQLVAQVAAALEHAHDQGIVHRDLKPSNIMLTPDGSPRVMDFGLAKRDAGEVTMTVEGQVLGTPAYMSPEQASGQAHHVDGRSDIYSLGGILYELLTGELPFRGNQRMILHQVLNDEPRGPRSLNDRIPRDLETICLKAMSKEPSRRYPTAQAMADDLARFLSGQPITARPVGRLERGWRWCKREPMVAGLSAMVVVVLFVGTGISTMFAIEAQARAREALAEKARADAKSVEASASADRAAQEKAKATAEALRAKREAEVANAATDFMTSLFQTSDSIGVAGVGLRREGEDPKQLTLQEVLRRGSQRVQIELKQQPLLQARLMNTIGNINRSLGSYQEAEALLRESLTIRERHAGGATSNDPAEQLALAESQFNLAWLLHDLGHYAEAESLYRKALQTRVDLLEPHNGLIATTRFNLAWVLADLSRLDEAEQLFREVLRTRRNLLPPDHRDILLAQIGLAAVLWTEGKNTEILKETMPTLPGDLLVKILSVYELARLQKQLHRYDLAVRSYQIILDNARQILPPQHPLLAAILIDMAGLLKEKGDYPAAEKAIREAIRIVRNVMGGHPKLVDGLRDFAVQLEARGDFDEAEQLYLEALAISLQRRAWNHNEHGEIMRGIAIALRSKGQYDAARKTLEESLGLINSTDGANWENTRSLAQTCYAAGDWNRAASLYQELLARSSGDSSLRAKVEMRECLLDLGQYGKAREIANEVRAALEPLNTNDPQSRDTWGALVNYLPAIGEYDRAIEPMRRLLQIDRKNVPSDHPTTGKRLEQLASLILRAIENSPRAEPDQGLLTETEKLLADAEQMYRRRLGDDHPWVAQNVLLKAKLAAARGDAPAAAQLSERGVDLLGARFSPDHPWVLQARHALAIYQSQSDELPAALAQLQEVLATRRQRLPALDADVFETQLDLAKLMLRQGDQARAKGLLQETLDDLSKSCPDGGRRVARAEAILGTCLAAEKQYEQADRLLTRCQAAFGEIYGPTHPQTRQVLQERARLYEAWNKPDQAAELRRLLGAR